MNPLEFLVRIIADSAGFSQGLQQAREEAAQAAEAIASESIAAPAAAEGGAGKGGVAAVGTESEQATKAAGELGTALEGVQRAEQAIGTAQIAALATESDSARSGVEGLSGVMEAAVGNAEHFGTNLEPSVIQEVGTAAGDAQPKAEGVASALGEVSRSAKEANAGGVAFAEGANKGWGLQMAGMLLQSISRQFFGFGASVVQAGSQYQQTMEQIHTQGGASQAEVDATSKKVLDLAKTVPQGPQQLGEAMKHLEYIGLRDSAAMDALRTSALGAATGNANVVDTANAVGAAMVSQIKGAQSSSQAMSTLNAIVGAGNMQMQDLASAMGTGVLPAAQNVGLSLTDVGAALATLTDSGESAQEGSTRLRMTFSLMEHQSGPAAKALASIGIASGQLGNDLRQPDGLLIALEDIKNHLIASGKTAVEQSQVLDEAFGGGRSSAAITTLVDNVDRVRSKYQQIGEAAGKFGDDVKATMDTTAFKMGVFRSSIQAVGVQLGESFGPAVSQLISNVLTPILKGVEALANWFGKLSPTTQKWILAIAGGGAALMLFVGSLLLLAGTIWVALPGFMILGGLFMGLISPWTLLVAAVIAGVVLVATHWQQIKKAASDLVAWLGWEWNAAKADAAKAWEAVKNVFVRVWQDITTAVEASVHHLIDRITGTWNNFKAFVSRIWADIKNAVVGAFSWMYDHNYYFKWIVDTIRKAWDTIRSDVVAAWKAITGALTKALNAVKGALSDAWNAIETAAKAAWGAVLGVLTRAWDKTKGTASNAWQAISGVVSDAWNSLVAMLRHVGSSILDAIKGPFEQAKQWIDGIIQEAEQWGENLIHQFVRGIENQIASVASAASNAAKAVAKFLGFHSPTEEGPGADADTWAPSFMRMFTQGIQAGIPALRTTLREALSSPLTAALSPGASAMIAGAGGRLIVEHEGTISVQHRGRVDFAGSARAINEQQFNDLRRLMPVSARG